MIRSLVDLETAERVSRNMEGLDRSVMFHGSTHVLAPLKEKMVFIHGIRVLLTKIKEKTGVVA